MAVSVHSIKLRLAMVVEISTTVAVMSVIDLTIPTVTVDVVKKNGFAFRKSVFIIAPRLCR